MVLRAQESRPGHGWLKGGLCWPPGSRVQEVAQQASVPGRGQGWAPSLGPVPPLEPWPGVAGVSYLQPLQGGGRTAAWAPSCSPGPHRGLEVIQHTLLFILLCTQPCEEDCL